MSKAKSAFILLTLSAMCHSFYCPSAQAQTDNSVATAHGYAVVATQSVAATGDRLEQIVSAIRKAPNDLNLRRMLASELIKKGMTIKAAEQIKQVMALTGENAQDLLLFAEASRYSGDERTAIEAYKRALKLEPMNAKAWAGLSLAYAQNGDKQTAVATCRSGLAQINDASGRRQLSTTLNSIEQMSTTAQAINLAS